MTNKELFEVLLKEVNHIKDHMPNGELESLLEDMKEIKEDVSELKFTLLNPEDGVIVKTNKNTWWIGKMEQKMTEYDQKVIEFETLKTWQQNVTRALWMAFAAIIGIVVKIVFSHPV